MAKTNEQPQQPRGQTVDIPPVSTYFSQALGWRGENSDHGTITGRDTSG